MGIQADLFADCIEFIKEKNIQRLSDIWNLPDQEVFYFVENLLWNFDSIERDIKDDQKETTQDANSPSE